MRALLAIFALVLGCSAPPATPASDPAPPVVPRSFAPGYCTDYIVNTCEPPFATAMALCQQIYGKEWEELVSPVECWQKTPPKEWGCQPVPDVAIVCPGAEKWPSNLWCCPW